MITPSREKIKSLFTLFAVSFGAMLMFMHCIFWPLVTPFLESMAGAKNAALRALILPASFVVSFFSAGLLSFKIRNLFQPQRGHHSNGRHNSPVKEDPEALQNHLLTVMNQFPVVPPDVWPSTLPPSVPRLNSHITTRPGSDKLSPKKEKGAEQHSPRKETSIKPS